MSGTSSNIRFDQFDSMDPPGKPLPPEENQDESTEYPNSLDTWDTYGDFTGTDKQGKENNKWHPFKSKSLKEKGEMENTPSDQRQKLHKGEGTKGKKKESQNGLKPNSSEKQELSGSAMESPHTSLTEVVKSVAVVEDNMTDALKINIQQEVAVLQNKVMLVENENNKLLHDLPIINSEKMKLLIMKDNFFATTEERVTKHSQLEASELKECENNGGMEVWSKDEIFHDQEKKVLQEGVMDENNFDLRLVTQTLNDEITAFIRRWEQAEQQNAEYSMKEREIKQKQRELEEKNISLQRELAHLTEKLRLYQHNNDEGDYGVMNKATHMFDSLLRIEIKNKLRLKTSEIQVLSDCTEKLEIHLNGMEDERRRQNEQIFQLVKVKTILEELDCHYEAINGYEDMKKLLAPKMSEVSGLQTERKALPKGIVTAIKYELEVRKLEASIAKKDYEIERKEREYMASEIDDIKDSWKTERQEWQEKLQSAENELQRKETTISIMEKLLDELRAIAKNRKSGDPDSESEDYKARFFDVRQQFSRQKQVWSQKQQAFDSLEQDLQLARKLLRELQSAENELQRKKTAISKMEKLLDELRATAKNRKSGDPDGESEDYKSRFFDVRQQFSRQKQVWSQKQQAFDLLEQDLRLARKLLREVRYDIPIDNSTL